VLMLRVYVNLQFENPLDEVTARDILKRNDPYTHFSQQPHNKLTWLVVFYYFFTKRKEKKTKKIIKYYQPRQLVVGLL
jgi:hypothetical protein